MRIEEVRIGTPALAFVGSVIMIWRDISQQFLEKPISLFALIEPCPEVDTPSGAPTRCLITLLFQCFACRLGQFRRLGGRDVVSGIKPYQMRLMAVLQIEIAPVVIPFVEIAILTYYIWAQPSQRFAQFSAIFRRTVVKQFGGRYRVSKQFSQNGEVGTSSI